MSVVWNFKYHTRCACFAYVASKPLNFYVIVCQACCHSDAGSNASTAESLQARLPHLCLHREQGHSAAAGPLPRHHCPLHALLNRCRPDLRQVCTVALTPGMSCHSITNGAFGSIFLPSPFSQLQLALRSKRRHCHQHANA